MSQTINSDADTGGAPMGLEARLARLEREVSQLKTKVQMDDSELGWLSSFAGRFEGDPLFDEASELGRQWRQAQRDEPVP